MSDDRNSASGVRVALSEGEGWARTLTVTVPEERVSRTRAAVRSRLSQSVKLKGFRKGKVPAAVVEQRFGHEIDDRLQQRLLDEAYREALAEVEIKPAGPGRITDIRYEPGQPFVFQAELEVMPTIPLERTAGFRVERTVADVTDDEVASILERIRDENADWREADRAPEDGDRVSVRIAPLAAGADRPAQDATPYQLVLGEGKALDDVEAAIRSLLPGGDDVFEVEFPDEEGEDGAEAVVTRRLHITLDEVEEKQLPELTDEFASQVGKFSSLEELKDAVRADLARHHEREAEEKLRGELMNALVEANPFVVPQALVDRYLENMLQAPEDTDPAELARMREAIGPHAERQIRQQLLLEEIVARQELAATDEEVEERIGQLAANRGVAVGRLRREMAREGRIDALRQNLAVEKAFAYLKDQSGVS